MTTLIADNIRAEVQKAESRAKEKFADLDALRKKVIEEGVNPLDDSEAGRDAFAKLDEAGKEYDSERQAVMVLQTKLDRLTEIEGFTTRQPAQRPLSGQDPSADGLMRRGLGARFVESEQYQALHRAGIFQSDAAFRSAMGQGFGTPVEIVSRDELVQLFRVLHPSMLELSAVTVTGGGATSAGPFIQNDLIAGFVAYARKRPLLAAMVGPGETDSDVVEYVTQTAPTDAAAETAEDTAAPESTYAFATNTTNVREVTHFVPVTTRAMADFGQIRSIVENELALGAIDRLDTQIASGNGAGQNLTGIYNAAGIGTQALGTDSRSDALHKAITLIRVAAGVLSEPDFIGIHPNDAQDLRLEKDSQGNYIYGPPSSGLPPGAWGVPLAVSTVFTSGTPLVGDFTGSSRLWMREALAVTSGLSGTDFTQRRVSLLAALRAAFAVTRAGGFATVTGF